MPPVPRLVALLLLLAAPALADDPPPGVLVIGDSHTAGTFGHALDKDLRAPKTSRIATFGVCSSRPQSFLSGTEHACGFFFKDYDGSQPADLTATRPGKIKVKVDGKLVDRDVTFVRTPLLSTLLDRYAPKAVIVALGSNGLSDASVKEVLERIHAPGKADPAKDRACFWIGPPPMRNTPERAVDAWYAQLAANNVSESASPLGGSCKLVIDSRKLGFLAYPEKGGDGTHYEGALAPLGSKWGHAAYDAFVKALNP